MHAVEVRAITGVSRDHTASHAGGPLLQAVRGILTMRIVLMIGHDDALERAPAAAE